MRTFRAMSFISRIIPSAYMTLGGIMLLGIVFFCLAVRCHHVKGIKNINLNGIIMAAIGVIIILVAGAAMRDAQKYTYGTKKTTATVTNVYEEFRTDESNDYIYTIGFSYENQQVSVKMQPTHRMNLDQGDSIEVYFYPEEIGQTENPIVVAVDLEKKQAKGNMVVGGISCIIGLLLICLANSKQKLLSNGLHTSATVIQIAVNSSNPNSQNNRIEKTLICQGKNPGTGLMQTFRTHGTGLDFLAYNDGDIVHVFIHKKNSRFYIINI